MGFKEKYKILKGFPKTEEIIKITHASTMGFKKKYVILRKFSITEKIIKIAHAVHRWN